MKTPRKDNQGKSGNGARQAYLVAFLAGFMVFTGCGLNNQSSDLKHNINEPVNHSGAYLWEKYTPEMFNKVIVPIVRSWNEGEAEYLEDSHELVKKSQSYLDTFHDELVKRHPKEMANVPRPVAKVLVDPTPNAYVMPVPVCYSVPVVWGKEEDVSDAKEKEGGFFDSLLKKAGLRVAPAGDVMIAPEGLVGRAWNRKICEERSIDEAFEQYIAWFTKDNGACDLTVRKGSDFGIDADKVVHVGDKCRLEPGLGSASYAARLVLTPVASIVTFHSGLATIMNEEEFISVAGHELGHYYRAHPVVNEVLNYEFFYKMNRENGVTKPKADPSLQEFGEKLKKLQFIHRRYFLAEGQTIRTELFMPSVASVIAIGASQDCSTGECNKQCAALDELVASDEFQASIDRFPAAPIRDGLAAYLEFEKQFLQCAGDVKVTEEGSEDGSAISGRAMQRALAIDTNIAQILRKTPMQDTVLETIKAAEKLVVEAEAAAAEPLKKAHEMKLGYYTTEQEADEIALEWMSHIGVDPKHAISAELILGDYVDNLYKQFGVRSYPYTVNSAECRKLYENGWEKEGDYSHIPIGDFADNHHSSCFRAFNLHREVAAHKWKVSANSFQTAASDWSDIQADLNSRHAQIEEADLGLRFDPIEHNLRRAEFKNSEHPLERRLHGCRFYGNL